VLREKLLRYRPGIAWFHGRLAYARYLKYGEGVEAPKSWGRQPLSIGTTSVFVTPNPSPANATYSLSDLIAWYCALKELRDVLR
jgi:TDG/mug DNA glycosylase family protein